jgi:hypothetical protein
MSAPSVSLAGQPSRIGGAAAGLLGWTILVVGLSVAVAVGLLLQSLWPAAFIGWAFGVPIGVSSLFFGLLLILTGRGLRRRGNDRQRAVQLEAVRALLANRGGSATAREAAQALELSDEDADALLMELARDPKADASVEVEDSGQLRYVFGHTDKRWRVLEEDVLRREQTLAMEEDPLETVETRRARR